MSYTHSLCPNHPESAFANHQADWFQSQQFSGALHFALFQSNPTSHIHLMHAHLVLSKCPLFYFHWPDSCSYKMHTSLFIFIENHFAILDKYSMKLFLALLIFAVTTVACWWNRCYIIYLLFAIFILPVITKLGYVTAIYVNVVIFFMIWRID